MNPLTRIRNVHIETDARSQERERQARTLASRNRWGQLRDMNDQAYFMLMFAQFEDMIAGSCNRLVDERRKNAVGGKNRRVWEMIRIERLSFMDRTAMLTDKTGPDYALVKSFYDRRNDIAHGNFAAVVPINLASDYAVLRRLWSELLV